MVRFTEAENVRLHQAAERLGGTIQNFLHDAVVAAIEEHESKRGRKKVTANPAAMEITPRGYGLRQKMQGIPSYSTPEPPEPPPAPAPQIVITTAPQMTVSEIDRLAAFVVNGGQPADRDRRLETAVKILAVSSRDAIERDHLTRELDEKVATLEPRPTSTLNALSDWFFGNPK